MKTGFSVAGLAVMLVGGMLAPALGQHVPELATYFDHVQIAEPVVYRNLAVYPIILKDYGELRGGWLTLDDAISRGVLDVFEKGGGGSVPEVVVQNTSRNDHVFIMSGEVISGGKQTRTVRHDVVVAPGQRIAIDVFCVEAHRWEGGEKFSSSGALVPQSIQQELRRGSDQQKVWSEVARNNAGLGAENPTGSLDRALKAAPVRDKLADVKRNVMPQVPAGTAGFIFVDGRRAVGADFFGRDDLARALLPKLLDSYAVDFILLQKEFSPRRGDDHQAAIDFFERIRRAGSQRVDTPGAGAGIRTRSGGLLGDGVSLSDTVVHYGVQTQDRIIPRPEPPRPIPLPGIER
jgi:hypothetical protein